MELELKNHERFRLDGKTEEEFFAEPLPREATVPLTKEAAEYLSCRAFIDDRSIEYVAARHLHELAIREQEIAAKVTIALARGGGPKEKEPAAELAHQRKIMADLAAAGISAESQVGTESGDADIVVYDDGKPQIVIELKASLRKRREVLQASGQARAYAEALQAKHYFLSAPEIDPSLFKKTTGAARVVSEDNVVAEVNRLLGSSHVVSIADRR